MSADDAVRVLSRAGAAAEIAIAAEQMRNPPAGTLAFARDPSGNPAKGLPWSYGGRAAGVDRGAPRLGEDNEYVVRQILGFGEADYRALEEEGVLGDAPAERSRVVDKESVPSAGK
jgi:hypothetical protein